MHTFDDLLSAMEPATGHIKREELAFLRQSEIDSSSNSATAVMPGLDNLYKSGMFIS